MGFFGKLIEGVGIAKHKTAVEAFLKRVVGLDLPPSQVDSFTPLIAAGYREGSSIEDIALKIATAFYAKACTGSTADRAVADRLLIKLQFAIGASGASGAISAEATKEYQQVVSSYTQRRMLRED
jgi:hypothetical protein